MIQFSASLPQLERCEIKHNHSKYITDIVRVNVVVCSPYCSCVCVFLFLVAMEKKCVLLWKQLKRVQNHWCSCLGGKLWLLLGKHIKSKQKITLPKILVYCLAESESSTAYYSRSIHQPAKSLWEAYDHFSVCICVCVLIFEHVTIGSYFAQISSFSPFLAPNRHLPRVSWSASFVITGIYHVGRCLWTDGNRLRTNYLIPYKFQHWDILF